MAPVFKGGSTKVLLNTSVLDQYDREKVWEIRYLIDQVNFCQDVPLKVVNVIPIKSDDFKNRRAIRRRWGRSDIILKTGLRPLFLLGLPSSNETQRSIEAESRLHRDLIQLDFVDTYLNLSLKTMSALHWKHTHCPSVPWLLKSDSDVILNVFKLPVQLTEVKTEFACFAMYRKKVCRPTNCRNSLWIISKSMYPSSLYPTYCNGPAYAVAQRAVLPLFTSSNKTDPFPMEDVYFTGMLREQRGFKVTDIRRHVAFNSKSTLKGFVHRYLFVFPNYENESDVCSHSDLWINLLKYYGYADSSNREGGKADSKRFVKR
ncbi:beta-1,3-galactosyltransferase 5-like [Oratosquilla oratoria]|uniref:beta-1,3-galactosyltransferase 5-like n=1 Tax=Oratosquilla oratoria TaxID=337810 RepID=UPI003F76BAC0